MRALSLVGVFLFCLMRSAFGDDLLIPSLTLDDYVKVAVQKGVQGQKDAIDLEIAGYTREIAFRQTDSPNFSVGHTHTRKGVNTNGFDSISDSKQSNLTMNEVLPTGTQIQAVTTYDDTNKPDLSASITQPIYIFVWNSVLRTRRRADLSFANAKDNFDSLILTLRANARSAYYDVMLGEESIKVEERKVASSRKLLDITQALVQAGKTAPVERMRAKIREQEDERQLENAQTTYDKAIMSAKNFAFLPLDEPIHFVTTLQFKHFDVSLHRLQEYALLHNPNLKTLHRAQDLAHLDTQTAMETTRPQFNVKTDYNADPYTVSHGWSLQGNASWLFFDSFVTRDAVRTARLQETVANLNLLDAERTVRLNVRNGYLDIKNAEKQIDTFQASREQAIHNVEVIRLRFQNGLDRLIDVFNAEDDMRNLDNEYLNLLVSYNRSKDNLSQQVGVDVETLK